MGIRKNSIQHLLNELNESLLYYTNTGELVWLKHNCKAKIGTRADKIDSKREYRYIYIKCKQYAAHRIIWLMETGQEPVDEIDHINLDGLDNSWENLRESNFSQNQTNRAGYGKSGFKGVSEQNGAFRAEIQKDKIIYKLGTFSTAEEASQAYQKASLELHKEYSRTNHKNN